MQFILYVKKNTSEIKEILGKYANVTEHCIFIVSSQPATAIQYEAKVTTDIFSITPTNKVTSSNIWILENVFVYACVCTCVCMYIGDEEILQYVREISIKQMYSI